jgi:hypothetical protein
MPCRASFRPIGRLPYCETTVCEACGQICDVIQSSPDERRHGIQQRYGLHFTKEEEAAEARFRQEQSAAQGRSAVGGYERDEGSTTKRTGPSAGTNREKPYRKRRKKQSDKR